jgi:hypothetical protein
MAEPLLASAASGRGRLLRWPTESPGPQESLPLAVTVLAAGLCTPLLLIHCRCTRVLTPA